MRKVKPLVLPFFCEGYDRDAAAEQVNSAVQILQQLGLQRIEDPAIRKI